MRNLKKVLALVLALMMALSVMVFASANVIEDYPDAGSVSAEYSEAVDVLTGMGIFEGDEGGFRPQDNITRAEVAALVYRVLTTDVTDAGVGKYVDYGYFTDVPSTEWYAGYVNYVANGKHVVGTAEGIFAPDDNVTGYEMLTIMLRAVGYGKNAEFEGDEWTINVAQVANQLGITAGLKTTLGADLTREEVAYVIFKTLLVPQVTHTPAFGYSDSHYNSGTLVKNTTLGWDKFQLAEALNQRDDYGRPSDIWYRETNADADPTAATTNIAYDPLTDGLYATIEATPVATYYTAVIDCDVTDDVNNGKTFTVPAANIYTNGAVAASDRVVRDTDTVSGFGQQGRTTEVYYVNNQWSIVFVDTYLAKVTAVVPAVVDTAGHEISPATMTLQVTTNASTPVTVSGVPGNDYAVGSYVLFTQHAALGSNGLNLTNLATHAAEVDVVGAASSVDVTVSGIHRTNGTLDGVVAGGTTYLANHSYTANSSALWETLELSMITNGYRLYLDGKGNLVGMVPQGVAANVGVVTAFQANNVATGKWALQADLYLADGTTATMNFVNPTDDALFDSSSVSGLAVGDLISFQPITVDGASYYNATAIAAAASKPTDSDGSVVTGVTDAITTGTSDLDDNTRFIVANYGYDYSKGTTVLQGYSVYTGFKSIPTLTGTTYYQTLTVDGVDYYLFSSNAASAYVQTPKATVTTDDNSALFLSKGTTYQFYSTYNVVIDGVKTTVNVSNSLETHITFGQSYSLVGLSNDGYYTGLGNGNAAVGLLDKGSNPTYAAGVLTYTDSGTKFLTVADDCQVYIVNTKSETVYAASMANLATYAAEVVNYEVNDYGYITHLYLTDADRT